MMLYHGAYNCNVMTFTCSGACLSKMMLMLYAIESLSALLSANHGKIIFGKLSLKLTMLTYLKERKNPSSLIADFLKAT